MVRFFLLLLLRHPKSLIKVNLDSPRGVTAQKLLKKTYDGGWWAKKPAKIGKLPKKCCFSKKKYILKTIFPVTPALGIKCLIIRHNIQKTRMIHLLREKKHPLSYVIDQSNICIYFEKSQDSSFIYFWIPK